MRNREVNQHKDRLDDLFSKVAEISDSELQAHWSRYLCILLSGFIETSIRSILSEYAENRASPVVSNYVQRELRRFQNPSMQRILDLLGSFSQEWAVQLSAQTTDEKKDAINNIIGNRNRIAHGENVGISFVPLRGYYRNAVSVLELIEEQCDSS